MIRLTAPVVLPCDEQCTVLRDAVVDVDDAGRLAYVGPSAAAPAAFPGDVLALTGILMPGLVNVHAHTAMTGLRGMGGDLPLMRWLTEVIWPAESRVDADDVRAGMLVGARRGESGGGDAGHHRGPGLGPAGQLAADAGGYQPLDRRRRRPVRTR
jgi:5-methylthioadenosine/S-adenosylhomocysteine deaminase